MRFLYLTQIYPAYAELFYKKRPNLINESYKCQKHAFDDDKFSWNGVWENTLEPFGFEVSQVICNAEPMQKAWAQENDCGISVSNFPEFALAQIKAIKPEILFAGVPRVFDGQWIRKVREECPSIKKVIFYVGTASYDETTLRECDLILVPTKWWRDRFLAEGIEAAYLPHAFDQNILGQVSPTIVKPEQITFCGTIGGHSGEHESRERFLKHLLKENVELSIHSPVYGVSYFEDLLLTWARRSVYIIINLLRKIGFSEAAIRRLPGIGRANRWSSFPRKLVDSELRSSLQPPIFGVEMYRLLQNSFVTLNSHIGEVGDQAGNCRLFEATGVGTCLLTDARSNLTDFFEPDYEVLTYDSPEECFEKLNFLKENPAERDKIAERGQTRTLRDHTFEQRGKMLMDILNY